MFFSNLLWPLDHFQNFSVEAGEMAQQIRVHSALVLWDFEFRAKHLFPGMSYFTGYPMQNFQPWVPYTHKQKKKDSVGCIYSIDKYSYICVIEKQRKRSNQLENRGDMKSLGEGSWEGLERGKRVKKVTQFHAT